MRADPPLASRSSIRSRELEGSLRCHTPSVWSLWERGSDADDVHEALAERRSGERPHRSAGDPVMRNPSAGRTSIDDALGHLAAEPAVWVRIAAVVDETGVL